MKKKIFNLILFAFLIFFPVSAFGVATYDLNGLWTYETSEHIVEGTCSPGTADSGTLEIVQGGDEVTISISRSCDPAGLCLLRGGVTENMYTAVSDDITDNEGGTFSSHIQFTASSATSGEGIEVITYVSSDETVVCAWTNSISLTKSGESRGSISGRITTLEGSPIESLCLEVYTEQCWEGEEVGRAVTGQSGNYLITGIPPGSYYLLADGYCNDLLFIQEWWDGEEGTPYCQDAIPIAVTIGETTGGINLSLEKGNAAPEFEYLSVIPRTDGSGYIDILFKGSDLEGDSVTFVTEYCSYAKGPDFDQFEDLVFVASDQGHTAKEPMAFPSAGATYNAVVNASSWPPGDYKVRLKLEDESNHSEFPLSETFTVSGEEVIPPDTLIKNLTWGDGRVETMVEVIFNQGTSFTIDQISTIKVVDPFGTAIFTINDLAKKDNQFYGTKAGAPSNGGYAFHLGFGDKTVTTTATIESLRTIPIPAVSSFSPADKSVVATGAVEFSWEMVPLDSALLSYYLEISQGEKSILFDKGILANGRMGYTASRDILKAGESYTWMVWTVDGETWNSGSNCSGSESISFSIQSPDNKAPEKPEGLSPADEKVVGGPTALLSASNYSDPEGDTHIETIWMVRRWDKDYGDQGYDSSFNQTVTNGNMAVHTVSGLKPGLKYAWRVSYRDSGGNLSAASDEKAFKVGLSQKSDVLRITSGSGPADFNMVAFLIWPDNPESAKIFGDEMGGYYDTKNYRVGSWDPLKGGYVEHEDGLTIEPGRAYWFFARNGLDITYNGVPVSGGEQMEVKLGFKNETEEGWNQIASPNGYNYNWSGILVVEYDATGKVKEGPIPVSELPEENSFIDKRLWRWEYGSYASDTTVVEKSRGYWVRVKKDRVSLVFPANARTDAETLNTALLPVLSDRIFKSLLMVKEAYAKTADSPPAPMGGFKEETAETADSSAGCFILTTKPGVE